MGLLTFGIFPFDTKSILYESLHRLICFDEYLSSDIFFVMMFYVNLYTEIYTIVLTKIGSLIFDGFSFKDDIYFVLIFTQRYMF